MTIKKRKKEIKEWCQMMSDVDENLFVERLRIVFDDIQILFILHMMDNTCSHCRNANLECQCWNDE